MQARPTHYLLQLPYAILLALHTAVWPWWLKLKLNRRLSSRAFYGAPHWRRKGSAGPSSREHVSTISIFSGACPRRRPEMPLQEVVLCSTVSQTPAAGSGAIFIHDIQTGAALASFKQTNANPRCVAVLESKSTQGGFILAAQSDKSIMNVYNYQKVGYTLQSTLITTQDLQDQLALKIVLPEKLSCVGIDNNGDYCAAGTSQGRMYLWEVRIIGGHKKEIPLSASPRSPQAFFTTPGTHITARSTLCSLPLTEQLLFLEVTILASASGLCLGQSDPFSSSVQLLSPPRPIRLTNEEFLSELPTPFCSLSDHTLPITDIVCGVGVFPNCRVMTSSADHSVKVRLGNLTDSGPLMEP